jgi:hypothetical protein
MGWHFFFGAEHGRSTGQSGGHAPPDAGLLWSRALGARFKRLPNNTCWRLACVTDLVGGSSLNAVKTSPKNCLLVPSTSLFQRSFSMHQPTHTPVAFRPPAQHTKQDRRAFF